MNTNLLDLNNNILNIIGGYVKRDNERRIDKEDSFEVTDLFIKHLKENNKLPPARARPPPARARPPASPCVRRTHAQAQDTATSRHTLALQAPLRLKSERLSLKSGKILGNFVTTTPKKRSKSYRGKANVRSESGRTAGRHCGEQENLGMKSVAPCCCSVVPLGGGSFKTWQRWRRQRFFLKMDLACSFSTVDFARFWAAELDSYQAE
jgi:hypothetical protein